MAAPKPGMKVGNSQTGRPIMAALDLLGRRWALRILWELSRSGPCSFRDLQKLCGDISPTVLNVRLSELREAGIIGPGGKEGYSITEEGASPRAYHPPVERVGQAVGRPHCRPRRGPAK